MLIWRPMWHVFKSAIAQDKIAFRYFFSLHKHLKQPSINYDRVQSTKKTKHVILWLQMTDVLVSKQSEWILFLAQTGVFKVLSSGVECHFTLAFDTYNPFVYCICNCANRLFPMLHYPFLVLWFPSHFIIYGAFCKHTKRHKVLWNHKSRYSLNSNWLESFSFQNICFKNDPFFFTLAAPLFRDSTALYCPQPATIIFKRVENKKYTSVGSNRRISKGYLNFRKKKHPRMIQCSVGCLLKDTHHKVGVRVGTNCFTVLRWTKWITRQISCWRKRLKKNTKKWTFQEAFARYEHFKMCVCGGGGGIIVFKNNK